MYTNIRTIGYNCGRLSTVYVGCGQAIRHYPLVLKRGKNLAKIANTMTRITLNVATNFLKKCFLPNS